MVYAIMHDKFRKKFRKCCTTSSDNSRRVMPLAVAPPLAVVSPLAPGKPRPMPRPAANRVHGEAERSGEAKEDGVEGMIEVEVIRQTLVEKFESRKF